MDVTSWLNASVGSSPPRYATVLRFAFAALLIVSALGKLLDNRGFAEVLRTYEILPESITLVAALVVSLAELALGLALVVGVHLVQAAFLTLFFHLGYIAWLALAYLRGLDIPNCGCFGVFLARPLTGWTFVEDGFLVLTALLFVRGVAGVAVPAAGEVHGSPTR